MKSDPSNDMLDGGFCSYAEQKTLLFLKDVKIPAGDAGLIMVNIAHHDHF